MKNVIQEQSLLIYWYSKELPLVIVQFSAITRQGIRETTRYVVLGPEFSKAVSTPVYQVVPGQWQATIYTAKLLEVFLAPF